jgi:tetratricopeptide (TPR) repeat protein
MLLLCIINLCTIGGAYAQETKNILPVEREQQFLYYFYEAERLINLNQLEDAKKLLEFCYALHPDNATVNSLLGYYAQEEGDHLMAYAYHRRAFELEPNLYWAAYNMILLNTEESKFVYEAIGNLEKVAKDNPKDEQIHEALLQVYLGYGAYDEGLQVLDQIDSIRGYNEQTAWQRYKIYATLNKVAEAVEEVERYLEYDPENSQFSLLRVDLYEYTNQPVEKRILAYEAALKYDSRNLGLLNNLAWCLCISGGDLARAEQLSRYTILQETTNPIYLDTYGWIMYKLGDCESALFYLERAIEYSGEKVEKEIWQHYKEVTKKCK